MHRLLLSTALLGLMLVMPANAVDSNGYIQCTSADPFTAATMTTAPFNACVTDRCQATTGVAPTAISADGHCDGSGAAEKASTLSCDAFMAAFEAYYGCIQRAMYTTDTAPAYTAAYELYVNTPGFPFQLSNLSCGTCNNFESVFATTALPASCKWSCKSCCMQDPTSLVAGRPGKGFNHVLCGTGCVTSLLLMAFTIMSIAIFLSCGCWWPSPSLKTTVERLEEEQQREQTRAASSRASHSSPRVHTEDAHTQQQPEGTTKNDGTPPEPGASKPVGTE